MKEQRKISESHRSIVRQKVHSAMNRLEGELKIASESGFDFSECQSVLNTAFSKIKYQIENQYYMVTKTNTI